ncbi:DUF4192 domain-containing protein [Actinokineospora sp. UTMC 2448]|uniref:DUF4192 domain-containing protein n=1 Tax=Actinokineospora sp. UTMC 2448 TaxID=2268449 RepID=UPI0021649BFA|nr:DUF4192 domain-containing protein [Actinokineospora sp. UTMC 2448]UVS77934.1 hypothetical protein Actkin_01657 [Actinokineospora sp. UTMC 2448]
MTTALDPTLPLDDGGELVAAIPHLLGFHPTDSLVLITMVDAGIGAILRIDLPPQRYRAQVADHLAALSASHGAERAVAVVVGGSGSPPDLLPHRPLVSELRRAFRKVEIPVDHIVWVPEIERGLQWCCYNHRSCAGTVPDPDTSALGVGMLVRGAVKYASREALAATLTPDPPEVLERRELLIDARSGSLPDKSVVDKALDVFEIEPDEDPIAHYDDIVLDMYHVHAPPATDLPQLDEDTLVDLATALYDTETRGHCQLIAVTPRAAAGERLWTYLTRALPAPDRAEPACLLAVSAYLRGNGSLARVALDVALQACPGHTLAGLLTAALDGAMTPLELRNILLKAGDT